MTNICQIYAWLKVQFVCKCRDMYFTWIIRKRYARCNICIIYAFPTLLMPSITVSVRSRAGSDLVCSHLQKAATPRARPDEPEFNTEPRSHGDWQQQEAEHVHINKP